MTDAMKPSIALLSKLGSLIVHATGVLSPADLAVQKALNSIGNIARAALGDPQ